MNINLKIVTPEKTVYEDKVDSVTLMTGSGEITVLPNHVPLVSTLKAGELKLIKNGEEEFLAASTGFIEVRPGNNVVILADSAERAEELELEKIEEAKERARKLLEETRNVDQVAFANAAAMMERELARHRVATKRKKYRKV
jgi:F-type H+-transporting ATPase subunit epsilon